MGPDTEKERELREPMDSFIDGTASLSRKNRVLAISVGEDFVIACVVFTQCQRVTDGQHTDPDRS